MSLNKFLKYLTTERGRNFTLGSVTTASILMFSANYLPNTVFINKFREVMHAYRFGEEREVPEKLKRRFEYAMIICKCSDFEKKYLKPFIAYGFDTLHIGSTKSRFGGHVGIPTNYFYDKVSDVERADLMVRDKTIDWSSENGQNLQNSLVLSETEQVFGISRSILQIKSHKLMLTSLYPPICLMVIYAAGANINMKMNLFTRPLRVRLVFYTLLGFFGYGLYSFLTDYTQVFYDKCVDKELAEAGPEFVTAGIQFYDKLLKKNVALRNLTGENIYTVTGNEHYFLRQKNLPLTIRKCFFQMKQSENEKGNSKKNETVNGKID